MSHPRPCAKAAAPPPAGCLGEVSPIHIPGFRSVRVEQLLPPGLVQDPEGTCRPSSSSEPCRTLQTGVHTCQARQRARPRGPSSSGKGPERFLEKEVSELEPKGPHFSPSPPSRTACSVPAEGPALLPAASASSPFTPPFGPFSPQCHFLAPHCCHPQSTGILGGSVPGTAQARAQQESPAPLWGSCVLQPALELPQSPWSPHASPVVPPRPRQHPGVRPFPTSSSASAFEHLRPQVTHPSSLRANISPFSARIYIR